MIREEINELFVRAVNIEKKFSVKIEDVEKLTKDAFEILKELKENYYLVPKENIDSYIKFATTENDMNNTYNVMARFTICSISSIKMTLAELISDKSVKNYLKSELIRALEGSKNENTKY